MMLEISMKHWRNDAEDEYGALRNDAGDEYGALAE